MPGAQHFKVQGLLERPQHLGLEAHPQHHLPVSWHHPAERSGPAATHTHTHTQYVILQYVCMSTVCVHMYNMNAFLQYVCMYTIFLHVHSLNVCVQYICMSTVCVYVYSMSTVCLQCVYSMCACLQYECTSTVCLRAQRQFFTWVSAPAGALRGAAPAP